MKSPNKIQNVLTLKHSYLYYIKDISSTSKYNIEAKLYRDICEDFNKLLVESLINTGNSFTIPYRLGILRIKKRKINYNNLKPNFGLYNKSEGKLKNKYLNEHSGGYYCMFYWNKSLAVVRNKTAYCFIPTRHNKRSLASEIKVKGKELVNNYFE